MIYLENINKTYGKAGTSKTALDQATLSFAPGKVYAIIGASGSGKTTLLNVIGCMDQPTGGTYRYETPDQTLDITRLSRLEVEKYRKEHISFVFQQFALLNHYSVYENVELPLRARNVKAGKRKQIVQQCLEQMQIADLAHKTPAQISGGQQQRCAIARALATNGDIILADEPTGALDSKTGMEIMQIICNLKTFGKTVIIVTHDSGIAAMADEIIRIVDGRICRDDERVTDS